MSNLVLNAVQLVPAIAAVAPVTTLEKEILQKDFNQFKSLDFLVNNFSILEEISSLFKNVKSLKEQKKIFHSLSQEKQNEINLFFSKLGQSNSQVKDNSNKNFESRVRVDSEWHWFGVWNITFTKEESEFLVSLVELGTIGSGAAALFGGPIAVVAKPLIVILGLSLWQMKASMKASKYGNFYLAFLGIVPLGIHSGWNNGK